MKEEKTRKADMCKTAINEEKGTGREKEED
jgi:hypothetical protein